MSVQATLLPFVVQNQVNGHTPQNESMIALRALVQPTALNIITSLPGSPVDGNVYLVAASGTSGALIGNENRVAVRNQTEWRYLVPRVGWKLDMLGGLYVGQTLRWSGTAWVLYTSKADLVSADAVSVEDRSVLVTDGVGTRKTVETGVKVDPLTNALYGFGVKIKVITGTAYTLMPEDNSRLLLFTNALPITVLLPEQATQELPEGFQVAFRQKGNGQITFQVEGSDTVESADGYLKLRVQHSGAVVTLEVAGQPNTYSVVGDLSS